jgi:hypothetical protein
LIKVIELIEAAFEMKNEKCRIRNEKGNTVPNCSSVFAVGFELAG